MGIISVTSTKCIKDASGKITGYELLDAAGNKRVAPSEQIIGFIESNRLAVSNLRILIINNKKRLVNQEVLTEILSKAAQVYEEQSRELMSNHDYDKAYDTLKELEQISGSALPNSVTQIVGAPVSVGNIANIGAVGNIGAIAPVAKSPAPVAKAPAPVAKAPAPVAKAPAPVIQSSVPFITVPRLEKKAHPYRMLSLDKVKDSAALVSWLNHRLGVISWKLDGLTVVLTYNNGILTEAVTRGNGEIGDIVTHNATHFAGIPHAITLPGTVIVRGEAVISYTDFAEINRNLPETEAQYKNPRNLASGAVRQLDSRESAKKRVQFKAFSVTFQNPTTNSYAQALNILEEQGFGVVQHSTVTENNILETLDNLSRLVKTNPLPSDGLVLTYDDIVYGISLGNKTKSPNHSIAFKWQDDEEETTLTGIDWSPSRTGLINPVALFEPVELEGTTVTRAGLSNLSILRGLKLGIGDKIMVYKANMIIPQVSRNLTMSNNIEIPTFCPCCGEPTSIFEDENSGVLTLACTNEDCSIKNTKAFSHFAQRDAMNIVGLGESTIEMLIQEGFVEGFYDLYNLPRYESSLTQLSGFGQKSYDNLVSAVNNSRRVKVANFIYALGIDNIGLNTAKLISKTCNYDIRAIVNLRYSDLVSIPGIGDVVASSFTEYFGDPENRDTCSRLCKELSFIPETVSTDTTMDSISIAVHGSLTQLSRKRLQEVMEELGGKLVSSVTKSTTYLVTNQPHDSTNKIKAAIANNIPIISEADFLQHYNITV